MLRSDDRPGLEQETRAPLTVYRLLRMAMVAVIETRPGTDPDRAGFTTAMEAAKDQLTGFGTYKLNTPPAQIPSTNPPNP